MNQVYSYIFTLQPYRLPKTCVTLTARDSSLDHNNQDLSLDTDQVKRAVGFLIEHANLWSIPTVAHIFLQVIDIVAGTRDMSPSVCVVPASRILITL